MQDGKLVVPDHVVIPFIEGDGVGAEITPVCQKIVNTAVELAYVGKRRIEWKEVLAGGKAFEQTGEWFAGGYAGSIQGISGRYQRSVDHSGGRWYPFAECGIASDA